MIRCLQSELIIINRFHLWSIWSAEHSIFPTHDRDLLFYQSVLQIFISLNKFLQREEAIIPVVYDQIHAFMKKLFSKYVVVSEIRSSGDLSKINYVGK